MKSKNPPRARAILIVLFPHKKGSFMKLLIGILILLFVLTTISFSDVAYANQCDRVFEDSPEYSREITESEYSDATFNQHHTSQYFEAPSRAQDENSWYEFETNSDKNWDPTPNF